MALAMALNVQEFCDTDVINGVHIRSIKRSVAGVKLLGSWRADFYVALDVPFAQKMISTSRSLVSLIGQRETSEEIRVLMSAANRAPAAAIDSGIEVALDGVSHWAAQMAYQTDGVILTISIYPECEPTEFEVKISYLTESGGLDELTATLENIFDEESLRHHRNVLENKGTSIPEGGAEAVWVSRQEIFPRLRFLKDVEGHIAQLGTHELEQVFLRLLLLNRSAYEWGAEEVSYPRWRTKVTNESDSRRGLCQFRDDFGVERNYETHARYTPGAGRIHFRCVEVERVIEVAYIGEKL